MDNEERIAWISTTRLADMAIFWEAHSSNQQGYRHIWEVIAINQDAADAYYRTLDPMTLREEALGALAAAGWTASSINHRLS